MGIDFADAGGTLNDRQERCLRAANDLLALILRWRALDGPLRTHSGNFSFLLYLNSYTLKQLAFLWWNEMILCKLRGLAGVLSTTCFALVGCSAFAQAQVNQISEEDRIAFQIEADIWLSTVFGYCLCKVTGETYLAHPPELQGDWKDLRPDYASTLLKPLYNPKESVLRSANILDLSPGGESCWTQHSTIIPQYALAELDQIRSALVAENRLKAAYVDQGRGPQKVGVVLVGEAREPVILHQSATQKNGLVDIVTIVQKTVPGFVYLD
ncbi:MAG: hypothetical protein AAF667_18955 [Pseudomonadota bacterium]